MRFMWLTLTFVPEAIKKKLFTRLDTADAYSIHSFTGIRFLVLELDFEFASVATGCIRQLSIVCRRLSTCVGVFAMRQRTITWRPNCVWRKLKIVNDSRWDPILLFFWAKSTAIDQYRRTFCHPNCKFFAMILLPMALMQHCWTRGIKRIATQCRPYRCCNRSHRFWSISIIKWVRATLYVGAIYEVWLDPSHEFHWQRVPKLQAEDQAIWWDTLNKMQKLLRKAAASLHAAGKFEKDLMHNYFMSGELPSSLFLKAGS